MLDDLIRLVTQDIHTLLIILNDRIDDYGLTLLLDVLLDIFKRGVLLATFTIDCSLPLLVYRAYC